MGGASGLTYPGPHRAAWAIEGLAVWYLFHGHRELARSFLTNLERLLKLTGDEVAKQRVRHALGGLYRRYPPRSSGRQAFSRDLLVLAEEENDALVLNDLGLLQCEEKAYSDAIATFEKAFGLIDGSATALRATLHGNLAIAQEGSGDTESAIRNLNRALEIQDAIGDREGIFYQLRNLGHLYLRREEPVRAIPLLTRAVASGEGVTSPYKQAEVLGMLGDALVATDQKAEARRAYEQAAKAASESKIYAARGLYDFIQDKLAGVQDPSGRADMTNR